MVRIARIALATWFLLAGAAQAAAAPVGTPVSFDAQVTVGALERVPYGDGYLLSVSPTGESALVSRSRDGVCFVSLWEESEEVCQQDMPDNLGEHQWSVDGTHVVFATDTSISHGQDSDIWIMDRASASLTNLTEDGYLFEPQYASTPTCSFCGPDVPAEVQADVAAGYGPTHADARFPPETPVDVSPVFTLDGSTVIFARSVAGDDQKVAGTTLMAVKLSEGDAKALVHVSDVPLAIILGMGVLSATEVAFGVTNIGLDSDVPKDRHNGLWLYDWQSDELKLLREDDRGWLHSSRPLAKYRDSGVLVSFPLIVRGEDITRTCAYWLLDRSKEDLVSLQSDHLGCPTAGALVSPDGLHVVALYEYSLSIVDQTSGAVEVITSSAFLAQLDRVVGQEFEQVLGSKFSTLGWPLRLVEWTSDGYIYIEVLGFDAVRVQIAVSKSPLVV